MGILKLHYICNRYMRGTLAQLVEQRTENPCVPGSIPGGTTESTKAHPKRMGFCRFRRPTDQNKSPTFSL